MEQEPLINPDQGEPQRYRTLGVRLDEDVHARLSFIAQLNGSTLTDEIKRSIEARIDAAQDDPDLIARAEAIRTEIEREAQARQQAIAGFFGKTAVHSATSGSGSGSRRPRTSKRSQGSEQ